MTTDNAEHRTREALTWAIGETPIRLPEALVTGDGWQWDCEDCSLFASIPEGVFHFHVEAERRGSLKFRLAVMSIATGRGKRVRWEAEMPA